MGSEAVRASRERLATYREGSLHAALKQLYTRPGDRQEAEVDGFVVDVLRDDCIVEIQTGSFASVRHKLRHLVGHHRVLLVYPVTVEKWILRVDTDGVLLGRRRSPRRGASIDVFAELISFPELVAHPNFALELLAVHEDEFRRPIPPDAGRRRWPRDWERIDRRLLEVVGSTVVRSPADLLALLPPSLPDSFTTADLAADAGRPIRLAQRAAYCLHAAGCVEVVGRRGRSVEYRRATAEATGAAAAVATWATGRPAESLVRR